MTDDTALLIRRRMNEAAQEMQRSLTTRLYGDGIDLAKPRNTLRQRLMAFRYRLFDAWAVLKGDAGIGE